MIKNLRLTYLIAQGKNIKYNPASIVDGLIELSND